MRSKSQKRRREIGSFCRNHSSLSLCTPSVYVNICLGGGCNLLSCMTHTIYCEWQLLADLWRMTTAEVSLRLTAVMGKRKNRQVKADKVFLVCMFTHNYQQCLVAAHYFQPYYKVSSFPLCFLAL